MAAPRKKPTAKKSTSTPPPWSRPGAWTFVYETGKSRKDTLKNVSISDPATRVLPKEAFTELMAGKAATWEDGDRSVTLERKHLDVIRFMVGEYEESPTAWVMQGRGVSLHVLKDSSFPLILVREETGRYERLVEMIRAT